jgi:SARP family transcriptional regulator, regulator of embCAB operon
VLAAWCGAIGALSAAREGRAEAPGAAAHALTAARHAGVPGAVRLAELARASCTPRAAGKLGVLVASLHDLGLVVEVAPPAPIPARLRCFGGFFLEVGGTVLDLEPLKPRARSLLRVLAAAGGRPIHREAALAALWPDASTEAATRSFHVALSSLRGLLDAASTSSGRTLLRRDGEAYRLDLGADGDHDLVAFEVACAEARSAQHRGDAAEAVLACRRALARYTGELLPEEGPAEWVLPERDRYRQMAAGVAVSLAALLQHRGDLHGAVEACEAALVIDRYRDDAWQRLVELHEAAGATASAAVAQRRYAHVLAALDAEG